MRHETALGLIPLYALDALQDEERREVEFHVTCCAACRRELTRHASVADALSGEMKPSARVWARIVETIESR